MTHSYHDTHTGYVPTSPAWHKATTMLWERYSLELDSWRDQPLWCHVLQRLQIQPLLIEDASVLWYNSSLWDIDLSRRGHGGHTYANVTDDDAEYNQLMAKIRQYRRSLSK